MLYVAFSSFVGALAVQLPKPSWPFSVPKLIMFLQCQLAMITLGTAAAIGAVSMGGKQKAKTDGPPINATSKDEEKFIQYAHTPIVMSRSEL